MTPKLSKELTDALHAHNGELRVVDPSDQRVYIIIDDETHRRAMEALREREDWESIQRGAAQADAGQGMTVDEADQKLRATLGFPEKQ